MAQNNTIHNILEVVVGTADIRSSRKDLRHLRNLRDKTTKNKTCLHANMQTCKLTGIVNPVYDFCIA